MNWKIKGIKWTDSIVGRPAGFIVKKFISPRRINSLRYLTIERDKLLSGKLKILVIRPGGIGDAALLYPALEMLRKEFDDAAISILAEKRNAGVFDGCTYINKVFLYDSRPPFELINVLRDDYDIVIDTEQWHRLSALAAYLTKAPVRIGFATNERSEFFTHKVSYDSDHHEVTSFLDLVSALTGNRYDFNSNKPFIPINSENVDKFDNSIQELRKRYRAVVGIFSGATIRERKWGIERFADLTRSLSEDHIGIVMAGGKDDIDNARILERNIAKNGVVNCVGKTSLMETAAIISLVDVFVSSDTGLMHVAYGVGTPTVSLFGAGIQQKWAPAGENNIIINKHVPCSPCTKFGYTPRCPFDVRCLKEISVDEVKNAVLSLISRIQRP